MDLDPVTVAARNYPGWFTCNVPLWPRLLLIAANQGSFERLSALEQTVLREAARQASAASRQQPSPTQVELPSSVHLVHVGQHDLHLMREAVEPIHDELRSTGSGEETLAHIEGFLSQN